MPIYSVERIDVSLSTIARITSALPQHNTFNQYIMNCRSVFLAIFFLVAPALGAPVPEAEEARAVKAESFTNGSEFFDSNGSRRSAS